MSGSARKVLGFTFVALVALAAGGCSSHGASHPVAKSDSSINPASATPTSTGPATFALPSTLDGLTLSNASSAADLANATKEDLVAATADLAGDPVVGSYAGTGKDAAVLIGLPVQTDDANAQIDAVFNGLRSMDLYAINDPQPVGNGGMQCANATVLGGGDLKLGICVSADAHGSSILLRFTKDAAATGALLTSIASSFEK